MFDRNARRRAPLTAALAACFVAAAPMLGARVRAQERLPIAAPALAAVRDSAVRPRLVSAPPERVVVRDNAVQLSLFDAVALAIESNLDVQVNRLQVSIAATELQRAAAGGAVRGLDYTILESPAGVGLAPSPLLPGAAASVAPVTPPVAEILGINQMIETAAPWTILTAPFASGPNIPALGGAVIGQAGWYRRAATFPIVLYPPPAGPPALRDFDFSAVNLAYVKGFSRGTQIQLGVNNAPQAVFGSDSAANPFSKANFSFTIAQPLLRGANREVNLRFLQVAQVNQKLSNLLFYQQLVSTVYGVTRLYADLISLDENVSVKRDTLAAARKLHDDLAIQVRAGRTAPIELTRAKALVAACELDLIQAGALVSQQELILKSQLSQDGEADRVWRDLPVALTDRIVVPLADELTPVDDLVATALATRPDLAMATLQVETAELAVKTARNAARPEVDVFASYQTGAQSEAFYQALGTPGTGFVVPPADLAMAGLIPAKTFHVGVQFNFSPGNGVARADAARDVLQLRQAQARQRKLANDITQEVKSAVVGVKSARAALDAAVQSRRYQERLFEAECDKLLVGASTAFASVQQQGYVAQARATEAAARSTWMKAVIALQRATGTLLRDQGVVFADAVEGRLPERGQR